jgi:hypothetical protein
MPNPRMTIGDIAWSLLFMALFMPLMVGCVLALFAYGGANIASPPNGLLRVLGTAAVVVSIFLSWFLSLLLFGLLTCRFLSAESYERWRRQFDNAGPRASPRGMTVLGKIVFKVVRPRQVPQSRR